MTAIIAERGKLEAEIGRFLPEALSKANKRGRHTCPSCSHSAFRTEAGAVPCTTQPDISGAQWHGFSM